MKEEAGVRQRGAALFIVLALCALLTNLVGAAMSSGVSGARASAVFADIARADELGRGAADLVSYRLATGPPEALRGGRLAARFLDAEVRIDYLSESARIDANRASIALISSLLSVAGADPSIVARAVELIKMRRASAGDRPADGSAASSNQGTPPSLPATGAAQSGAPDIQSTLEVVRAWDLPDELAQRVMPALTVASESNQIDPILASRLVLLALLGGDGDRANNYMERRAQGFVNTDSALALLPAPVQASATFTDAKAVRAIARVTIARRLERSYEFILVPGRGSRTRPIIASWRKLL
jgi:general secretion pathway protein K